MGSIARNTGEQQIHFLRKPFTFADNGLTLTVGVLPPNSIILKPISGVNVSQVANAGTNNFMDIGNTVTSDLYGTDLSLLALGFIPLDEAVSFLVPPTGGDITVTATLQLSGTAATTGTGHVVIAYIPPN